MTDLWTYRARGTDHTVRTSLRLSWEITGDPISYDYTPDEIDAVDLLRLWVDRCHPDNGSERSFGPGMMCISWFVDGPEAHHFEAAPFTAAPLGDENFLTFYTWPAHVDTGEPLNWLTLPVRDKLWHDGQADKGGFLQEATGWKPSPCNLRCTCPVSLRPSPTSATSRCHRTAR
ncbi:MULTISPECIES: hypothetical protein [Saccharothrix]|uniref:hypothetical protein n=1 Tax=Saccharothrix TaxID=2071 RepID=UPI0009404A23|nr:hypothetical protein [Saccharothrix sp. CB00851]OKI23145.1 hypothetical protein A6A25_35005 [Saccharothrix sp. CB00851]